MTMNNKNLMLLDEWGRYPSPRMTPPVVRDYAKTFAIFGLAKTLDDFGIGSFEQTKVIEWFWRNSSQWHAQTSQEAFNKYARARISDFVGYSRRRQASFGIVDKLFDRAKFNEVTLPEVLDAVTFLTKTQAIPPGMVVENGDVTIVDLTLRADSPKLLKVDKDFFPSLERVFPFERIDDIVVKSIPIGETASREFRLIELCWWSQNPTTTFDEMKNAIATRNGDRLDWRRANLFSSVAARLEAKESGVPAEFPESTNARGETATWSPQYVELHGER